MLQNNVGWTALMVAAKYNLDVVAAKYNMDVVVPMLGHFTPEQRTAHVAK
jgi:hypothetical protein